MQFLGSLGIDWKLLIAQIINFGLLLWILSKFLYGPIVRQIEKNEAELNEAKLLTEKLTKDKEVFVKQKRTDMADAQKKVQKMFQEAETSAEEIRKTAYEEQKKMKQQLINQATSAADSKKDLILSKIRKEVSQEVHAGILEKIGGSISAEDRRILNQYFVGQIQRDIESEAFEQDIPRIRKVLESVGESGGGNKKTTPQLQRLVREKLGILRLESASPLSDEERKAMVGLLEKKWGIDPMVLGLELVEKPELACGLRLELFGRVFERNLYHIVHNAIENN
jgi:F-type H+-transporting ATPase subunit b